MGRCKYICSPFSLITRIYNIIKPLAPDPCGVQRSATIFSCVATKPIFETITKLLGQGKGDTELPHIP